MRWSAAAVLTGGLLLAGCGGERQDANEPSGTFQVHVTRTSFPQAQHLAEQSTFAITVRNVGGEAVPNLAVTVKGFSTRPASPAPAGDAGASDPTRPVWIVDDEPAGGVTAYDDTWTAGELGPGQSRTLRWRVTPVVAGRHRLEYQVAAGLDGKAKAAAFGGGGLGGVREVTIADEPARARVDPSTGDVRRLPAP